jgi:hypothetical protein
MLQDMPNILSFFGIGAMHRRGAIADFFKAGIRIKHFRFQL